MDAGTTKFRDQTKFADFITSERCGLSPLLCVCLDFEFAVLSAATSWWPIVLRAYYHGPLRFGAGVPGRLPRDALSIRDGPVNIVGTL